MPTLLVMLLQATPSPPPDVRFDLAEAERQKALRAPAGGCGPADANAIVICGSRGEQDIYRYRDLPNPYEEGGVPKAETSLGGDVTGKVRADSVGLPGGVVSKRIMVTVTKPF